MADITPEQTKPTEAPPVAAPPTYYSYVTPGTTDAVPQDQAAPDQLTPALDRQALPYPPAMLLQGTPRQTQGYQEGLTEMTPNLQLRNMLFDDSYLFASGLGSLEADAMYLMGVSQRVEHAEPGPENTWEGEECQELPPGKHGGYIVSARHRRFRIILTVHDSRVGTVYLLNRGDTETSSHKVGQNSVPNRYRIAVTNLHKLFMCEYENKRFYVQACEEGARAFNGDTTTSAWVATLKFYSPGRKNPRLSGPLYFGIALRPIQEACPGVEYIPRKAGRRSTTRPRDEDEDEQDFEGQQGDSTQFDGQGFGKQDAASITANQQLIQQQMIQMHWQAYNMQAAQQYRQQALQAQSEKAEEEKGEKETKTE
ncbi:hypothetical protein BLNAU_18640 [Blattamonas nauphoetae]|uniref:Uncharacterized protein n=1 Tax=Blattamonas nauphoetae TaxID=2049346 RepID=A0ABQ9X4Z5_9EUKA|nr:hypothetical protein BLNAU_18640 [Blattamonas nauphoetae]